MSFVLLLIFFFNLLSIFNPYHKQLTCVGMGQRKADTWGNGFYDASTGIWRVAILSGF